MSLAVAFALPTALLPEQIGFVDATEAGCAAAGGVLRWCRNDFSDCSTNPVDSVTSVNADNTIKTFMSKGAEKTAAPGEIHCFGTTCLGRERVFEDDCKAWTEAYLGGADARATSHPNLDDYAWVASDYNPDATPYYPPGCYKYYDGGVKYNWQDVGREDMREKGLVPMDEYSYGAAICGPPMAKMVEGDGDGSDSSSASDEPE